MLTSDNPRSEDPRPDHRRDHARARRRRRSRARRSAPRTPFVTNPDRRLAIEQAIRTAKPGDLVIIAGKGHEKYQVIGDRTLPFDDVEVARAALGQRRARVTRVTATVSAVVLTAGLVAEATGGRLVGRIAATACSPTVSTDTRTTRAGRAVHRASRRPVRRPRLRRAGGCARGAGGSAGRRPMPDVARRRRGRHRRADTLPALQALGARRSGARSGARVVAITGSAGKTTTKEVTAELLATRYRVFRNRGNLNNHIGLPLSLLELRHGPDMAVVELGMNHAGEIRTLVGIAEPDVRVWTNVGDAHIGHFGSREAVARAKAEILEGATPGHARRRQRRRSARHGARRRHRRRAS